MSTRSSNRQILLTGATGCLGSRVLAEILARTEHRVVCLLRTKNGRLNAEAAREELRNSRHVLSQVCPDFSSRVAVVFGNLNESQLGLKANNYRILASETDAVIHCGASTNLVGNRNELLQTNLNGTQELARFTEKSRGRRLVHVSTYSVIGDQFFNPDCEFNESSYNVGQKFAFMPYQESKFLAENVVRQSQCDWTIARAGQLFGDSETGLSAPGAKSLFWDILCSAAKFGIGFSSTYYFYDITPVDYVAKALLKTLECELFNGKTIHLLSPLPKTMEEVFETIRLLGYPVQSLSVKDYAGFLHQGQLHYSGQIYRSMTTMVFDRWFQETPYDFSRNTVISSQDSVKWLNEVGLTFSYSLSALLKRYFSQSPLAARDRRRLQEATP